MSTFRPEQLRQPLSLSGSFTGSLLGTASYADFAGNASSVDKLITSSSNAIYTASVSSNVITFTKGNGTFSLTVDTGSGGGPSSPDSPDRINGTATAEVIANLDANDISFISASNFSISTDQYENAQLLNLDASTYALKFGNYDTPAYGALRIGGIGIESNAEFHTNTPIRLFASNFNSSAGIDTIVQSNMVVDGIEIDGVDYFAEWPGFYTVGYSDETNNFRLPDPNLFNGLQTVIWNNSGLITYVVSSGGGGINGNASTLQDQETGIYWAYSGTWFGIKVV